MGWAGAPRACRPISFSPHKGSAKRPMRRQLHFPERSIAYPPVAGWTQSGIDPMRVEAGLNRLLLPCPARFRPADDRQHPLHPTGKLGRTRLAALGRAGPVPGSGRARDAQVRGRNARSDPASRSLCVVPKPPLAAPASQTGRSHVSSGAAAPPADAASHPPAGAAATSLRTKGTSMPSPNPRQCRGFARHLCAEILGPSPIRCHPGESRGP